MEEVVHTRRKTAAKLFLLSGSGLSGVFLLSSLIDLDAFSLSLLSRLGLYLGSLLDGLGLLSRLDLLRGFSLFSSSRCSGFFSLRGLFFFLSLGSVFLLLSLGILLLERLGALVDEGKELVERRLTLFLLGSLVKVC